MAAECTGQVGRARSRRIWGDGFRWARTQATLRPAGRSAGWPGGSQQRHTRL